MMVAVAGKRKKKKKSVTESSKARDLDPQKMLADYLMVCSFTAVKVVLFY